MAILVSDPFDLNLTRRFLVENKLPVLVAGDDWSMRFQLRNSAGVGEDLSSALVIMTVRDALDGTSLFTRRSDTNIPSTSVKQILVDANQATEVGDTGKGWYQVNCSDEDAAALLLAVGLRYYDIRVKLAGGAVKTNFQGRIEILRPITNNPVA